MGRDRSRFARLDAQRVANAFAPFVERKQALVGDAAYEIEARRHVFPARGQCLG
jgi:hypothetical protein